MVKSGRVAPWIGILLAAALVVSCASPSGSQGEGAQEAQDQTQVEVLAAKGESGPSLDITAGPDSGSKVPEEGGGGGGIISSNGKTVVPVTPEPGTADGLIGIGGSQGGDSVVSSGGVTWITHVDEEFGFSISYPDVYVILPQGGPAAQTLPKPVYSLRFQDEEIASSAAAELELPVFSIEIFERPASSTLRDWIESNRLAPQSAEFEAVELAGAEEGLRLALQTMMAPNVFYYFATQKHFYRVVPLGIYGEEMLGTLKLPVNQ
jgi:hypothetical protein